MVKANTIKEPVALTSLLCGSTLFGLDCTPVTLNTCVRTDSRQKGNGARESEGERERDEIRHLYLMHVPDWWGQIFRERGMGWGGDGG